MRYNAKKKKAAHFLLIPELLYSPPNDAIIWAYLENGFDVDVYSPGTLPSSTAYGSGVKTYQVAYSWFWLFRHILQVRWLRYNCFSGTSEDPLAIVGILRMIFNKKSFALVDEIKTGSYRGDRSERWKKVCQWAMRTSSFNIVNDKNRIALLQEYARLDDSDSIIVYPGCFKDIPEVCSTERKRVRKMWGISEETFVIGSSGGFNMTAGADWLLSYVREFEDVHAVIQPLGVTTLSMFLLKSLSFSNRIYVQTERLGWKEAWLSAQALDVGLCIYMNQAPQFQKMGISSNRLCMFLAMGVPVIASYQRSFEFLEKYNCGVMVRDYDEFKCAVSTIRRNSERMSYNCRICLREYIRPTESFKTLKERIKKLDVHRFHKSENEY